MRILQRCLRDTISILEAQDDYAWLETHMSTVSDRVLEDDDAWLDPPMDTPRN
jgi:hypothetical protein